MLLTWTNTVGLLLYALNTTPQSVKNIKVDSVVHLYTTFAISIQHYNIYLPLQLEMVYNIVATCYSDFPGEKFVGMYQLQTPTLLLRDPETIRLFLVKSFAHFTDRGFSYDGHREPLTKHLVNLEGDTWKTLRQKLTPTFSSGKIKSMLGLLQGCGVQLIEYMDVSSCGRSVVLTQYYFLKTTVSFFLSYLFEIHK